MKTEMIKHEIKLPNKKPFTIWNDNGIVKQSGWFDLPEILQDFTDSGKNAGFEAGAYMAGMMDLIRIANDRFSHTQQLYFKKKDKL